MTHVLGDISKEETMNKTDLKDEKFERKIDEINEPVETENNKVSESFEESTFGIVVNCKKLNIRKEPEKRPDNIVQVVDANAELMVDASESTSGWYKVYSAEGIEGYCMKEFITLS